MTVVHYADVATLVRLRQRRAARAVVDGDHVHVRARGRAGISPRTCTRCTCSVRALEHAWGYAKFIWFYLLCGLGGVAFEMLFMRGGGLVGASARGVRRDDRVRDAVAGRRSVSHVRRADARAHARRGLFVFNLVLGLIGTTATDANVAYFAHIGGAIVGVHLHAHGGGDEHGSGAAARRESARRRRTAARDSAQPAASRARRRSRRHRREEQGDRGKARRVAHADVAPPRGEGRGAQRVLDKISEQGIDSLTSDERKVLEEMSRLLGIVDRWHLQVFGVVSATLASRSSRRAPALSL